MVETTGEEVLSADAADRLEAECRTALLEAAREQAQHQRGAEPTARYLELLGSALSSGRAHVADAEGGQPAEPGMWGWRQDGGLSRAQGERIGWLVGGDLYLDPTAAFKVAQGQAPAGEGLAVSEQTLRKRLSERGLLVTTDENRRGIPVRRVLGGRRVNVLHLRADAISGTLEPREEIIVFVIDMPQMTVGVTSEQSRTSFLAPLRA